MYRHVIEVLRDYMGINQKQLADMAGITQADLSEIETKAPYGFIDKYMRLSSVLSVPIHTLVTNDYTGVPLSFFETHAPGPYSDHTKGIGREGEEAVFQMEQERLRDKFVTLDRMVLPCFKIRNAWRGFDILSYDDSGKPVCIEVKTSTHGPEKNFHLTTNEYKVAQAVTAAGYEYYVYRFVYWGKPKQELYIQSFREMLEGRQVVPTSYTCSLEPQRTEITGIAHFRQLRGMTQEFLAQQIDGQTHNICLYESGHKTCKVETLLKLSSALNATIDELLSAYPVDAWKSA